MRTCGTCRHWSARRVGSSTETTCDRIVALGAPRDAAARILLTGAEAELATEADFGCALHEPHDAPRSDGEGA